MAIAEFPQLEQSVVRSAVKRMLNQKIYPATPSISKEAFLAGLDLQVPIGNIKAGQSQRIGDLLFGKSRTFHGYSLPVSGR